MRSLTPPNTMPDTSAYYHIAYTVALGIYAAYAVSLYARRKNLRRR
jgi:hypothetical protein